MKGKSEAAANLCSFVVNVINYNRIWRKVKPLMEGAEAVRRVEGVPATFYRNQLNSVHGSVKLVPAWFLL